MSNLYELIHRVNSIEASLAESAGEVTPEIEAELAVMQSHIIDKVDSFHFILERLDLASEHWKKKAQALQAMARGCETVQRRIKDNIKAAMETMNTNELEGADVRFTVSDRTPKLVINEEILDEKYKRQVVSYEPDKERIKELLQMGIPVPGCSLEPVKALTARPHRKGKVA